MRLGIVDRLTGALIALVALVLVAVLALAARASSLDPPAGPGSSMKTLADVPRAWRVNLSTAADEPCQTERFQCVLSGAAVLDQETGLVWERVPYSGAYVTWFDASAACVNLTVGGRSGWRLPTVAEMQSLFAPGQSPRLPANHPFTVTAEEFDGVWSATVDVGNRARAYWVRIDAGGTGVLTKTIAGERYWCVRAPDPAAPR